MLNQVPKVSWGTCQQFVEDAVIFGSSNFARYVATYCRWEFSYESVGKRILKTGPHLPKLLSNDKWLTIWDSVDDISFFETHCTVVISVKWIQLILDVFSIFRINWLKYFKNSHTQLLSLFLVKEVLIFLCDSPGRYVPPSVHLVIQ